MRTHPQRTYAQTRCALTRHLRKRAQCAEAEVEELRAELERVRRAVTAERRGLVALTESAAWERDLLLMARDRVRAELLRLSLERQSCPSCGSFGRGVYDGLLQDEIDRLTAEHALPRVPSLPEIDWPARMGAVTKGGRVLRRDWLEVAGVQSEPKRYDGCDGLGY